MDNSGMDSMDESGKGDDFENNSGETDKDGANRIFIGTDSFWWYTSKKYL